MLDVAFVGGMAAAEARALVVLMDMVVERPQGRAPAALPTRSARLASAARVATREAARGWAPWRLGGSAMPLARTTQR